MKNILCFILSFMLVFNTTVVYADIHGGSGGSLDDPTKLYPALFDENGNFKPPAGQELFNHMIVGDKTGSALAPILSTLSSFLDGYDNSNGQGISVETNSGGSTVHFHGSFIDELNAALQNQVHALDGYYLLESSGAKTMTNLYNLASSLKMSGVEYIASRDARYYWNVSDYIDRVESLFIFTSNGSSYCYGGVADKGMFLYLSEGYIFGYTLPNNGTTSYPFRVYSSFGGSASSSTKLRYSALTKDLHILGSPAKIFYSFRDLQNYLNNGQQRIYAPKLPSGGFKINIKYINNTTSLPDITYNITTENKSETEIQNQYDTTINNYINNLNNFTDGGGGTTNPTPTPSGGGSGGDFGDGTTPTPKPDFSDGSLTDTNTLLQKILDKLTEFSLNHDKLAKTITDYIEANDGKLDQIIEAINALSDGKTEDEKNGCKYDFTALSDFMTKLWNESDKKFDKMVELLEENNKYQKKLVNSLNEIKAILVTQTIMDVFQDRSQQTAEKAKDKFPTSLPWDIALVVNAMSAEPEKPQFNLPIQIKSLNINEEIHVDLASGEWEKLAKTCRYLLSILFILLMIQLSRKLFSNGGDD